MKEKEVIEWLDRLATTTTTKVKVERQRRIKAEVSRLKELYAKYNSYEKAGLVYVCEVLNITPEEADKVFRTYALMYRRRKEKEDGSVTIYVDLPLFPVTGHLKYYADKGLPIQKGWYSIGNAICRLTGEQEERILSLVAKKDTLK